jgi:hypothetical protein
MASLDGTNRAGIYVVKLKLNDAVPELLPIMSRHIKISNHGILRLFTSCFETTQIGLVNPKWWHGRST